MEFRFTKYVNIELDKIIPDTEIELPDFCQRAAVFYYPVSTTRSPENVKLFHPTGFVCYVELFFDEIENIDI